MRLLKQTALLINVLLIKIDKCCLLRQRNEKMSMLLLRTCTLDLIPLVTLV
jgi:hypothetical protein